MLQPGILALIALVVLPIGSGAAQQAADSALDRIVRNYTELYASASFDGWAQLFRPGFTSVSTNADGSLTMRSLAEFLEAQRRGFERAREMREELQNVRVEQHGQLASVWADFVFYYDGKPSRGKLVLLAVRDTAGWRFSSLMFSYERAR
jgi:SnoaL-like domain